MTETVEILACATCGRGMVEGYPHRHSRPLPPSWDPMPPRPDRLYCGPLDPHAYWTGADWRPSCCMVHVMASETMKEIPEQLHPFHATSRTGLVGIPRRPKDWTALVDVPDSGPLGGWPWASRAHRRLGAVTMLEGEQTLHAGDYRAFPWAYAIEVRLMGYCRRRHVTRPDLWPEHHGEPICSPLIRQVLERGVAPEELAGRGLLPAIRIRPVLEDVLPWLWRRVSDTVNGVTR